MIEIDLNLDAEGWSALPEVAELSRQAAEAALAVDRAAAGPARVLSLLLTGDERMRELNRAWRGEDKPTNVLSFASGGASHGGTQPLGDIVLAYETVAREAEADGKSLADHASHLIVHGVLHLLGHDHEEEAEAETMESLEIQAMARLGRANPYRNDSAAQLAV